MGLFKSWFDDIKKDAIESSLKPSKKQLSDERISKVLRENTIIGKARKIADEKGIDLETLMREANEKVKKMNK